MVGHMGRGWSFLVSGGLRESPRDGSGRGHHLADVASMLLGSKDSPCLGPAGLFPLIILRGSQGRDKPTELELRAGWD